jgi:hypothetical protein
MGIPRWLRRKAREEPTPPPADAQRHDDAGDPLPGYAQPKSDSDPAFAPPPLHWGPGTGP